MDKELEEREKVIEEGFKSIVKIFLSLKLEIKELREKIESMEVKQNNDNN